MFRECNIINEIAAISVSDIPIDICKENLPTDVYKERIKKINKKFFSDKLIKDYLNFLIANPNKIYNEEMYVHLKFITGKALECIFEADIEDGYIQKTAISNRNQSMPEVDLSNLSKVFTEETESAVFYREIMEILHSFLKVNDTELLYIYKNSPKLQSVFVEFPKFYLERVVEL